MFDSSLFSCRIFSASILKGTDERQPEVAKESEETLLIHVTDRVEWIDLRMRALQETQICQHKYKSALNTNNTPNEIKLHNEPTVGRCIQTKRVVRYTLSLLDQALITNTLFFFWDQPKRDR